MNVCDTAEGNESKTLAGPYTTLRFTVTTSAHLMVSVYSHEHQHIGTDLHLFSKHIDIASEDEKCIPPRFTSRHM